LETKTYAICLISRSLIITVFLAALIIGGVDLSLADKRNIYEVTAVNNTSKVTTVFQVYAGTERDAKENVALNGWTILGIRQITYRLNNAVPVQVGDGPVVYIGSGSKYDNKTDTASPITDEELIYSLLGSPSQNAFISQQDIGAAPMRGDTDPLAMTPDSEQLEYLFTVYFSFSVFTPTLSEADNETIAKLPKEGTYYLFGHTDNVSVAPNSLYSDNFELSFKRAETIKNIMTENGINPAKLITVGLGSLYPEVKNSSSAGGTLLNRRVEIYGLRTAK